MSTSQTWEDLGIQVPAGQFGNVKVLCPQCSHERKKRHEKSLSVHLQDKTFQCFHCGWTGSLNGGDWRDRQQHRAQQAPRVYAKPDVIPTKTILGKARDFLADRGIDPDLAAEVGVYSSPDGERLAFPYVKHGEVVHVKYRTISDKRFWSTKDTELTLYGYDDVIGAETVAICEGEMDRLAMIQAGIDLAVSVPNGAPAPGAKVGAKLDFLDGCEEIFDTARRVIVATDNDEPGRALANELVRRLGPERCYRVRFPDGCKDANDVLMQHGAGALAAMVDTARPEPVSGIITGEDLTDRLLDLYDNEHDTGLDFGYLAFDRIYRVKEGMFTVVTGHSSHGKSTALDQLLVRLAGRHGWHTAIFSPEQQPLERHQAQIIEQYAGQPIRNGPAMPKMSRDDMLAAHAWVSQHFTYIMPEEWTIDAILEKARVLVFRYGIKGLVIDPYNEIEHARPSGLNETEYISSLLQKIRNFARVTDLHVWLVAHPTKMPNNDQGEEQVPKLQNISGSIHFRNKADFGLTVFRDLSSGADEVDLIVTKSRWLDYAEPGRVRFRYDKITKRLAELRPVT